MVVWNLNAFRPGSYCLSFVVVSFVMTFSAQARLGENEVACAFRYQQGQDVAPTHADRYSPLLSGIHTTNKTYQYQGWTIQIGFMRGIAHRMSYRHASPAKKITAEEVKAILAANGGLSSWREAGAPHILVNPSAALSRAMFTTTVWERSDGARATLKNERNLTLDSAAYRRWSERPKPADTKAIPAF